MVKSEKEIARKAYKAAYNRECKAISENVRKMAAEIENSTDLKISCKRSLLLQNFMQEYRCRTVE